MSRATIKENVGTIRSLIMEKAKEEGAPTDVLKAIDAALELLERAATDLNRIANAIES